MTTRPMFRAALRPILPGAILAAWLGAAAAGPADDGFEELFPADGPPQGWIVTDWSDLKQPPPPGAEWIAEGGLLRGSDPRGTWLVSPREYGDFILRFEFRLGPRGNSGVALRAPLAGDPAFEGIELQMVDPRYFPDGRELKPDELTGSLYRAAAPLKQVFQPEDWNRYEITCRGARLTVVLNGVTIQDLDLDLQTARPLRHDRSQAPPLAERPRRGHIGFQELSRGGGRVEIRRARIKPLD